MTASPRRHSTSLNGPAPIAWVAMPSVPTFSTNALLTTWLNGR